MEVRRTGDVTPIRPVEPDPIHPVNQPTFPEPVDEVQISAEAMALDKIRDLPEIRAEKVEMVRHKIASGEYDDKILNLAVDRMLTELLPE